VFSVKVQVVLPFLQEIFLPFPMFQMQDDVSEMDDCHSFENPPFQMGPHGLRNQLFFGGFEKPPYLR